MNLPRLGPADAADGELAPVRIKRPWALMVAAVLLAGLCVLLWFRWTETRAETVRLRAELKDVYAEAEKYRMEAAQAQQKIGVLEQQASALRAEREEALAKLAAGPAKAKPAAKARPAAASTPRPRARR